MQVAKTKKYGGYGELYIHPSRVEVFTVLLPSAIYDVLMALPVRGSGAWLLPSTEGARKECTISTVDFGKFLLRKLYTIPT